LGLNKWCESGEIHFKVISKYQDWKTLDIIEQYSNELFFVK